MSETKEGILRAAIQLELDGQKFYLAAAQSASNDLARRMLESFAADEQHHIEWIEQLLDDHAPRTEQPSEIYQRLRAIFAATPDAMRPAVVASQDDIEAVRVASGMEQQSIDAYEKWAAQTDDDGVRRLCTELAEFERHHRRALDNTLEYLERTGDWFMQEEGWIFDGG